MDINITIVIQMLVFAAFVGFTMKYVWPPLEKALQERQNKIADACVMIVGAGGLGTPVATYLTAIGVGKISIFLKPHYRSDHTLTIGKEYHQCRCNGHLFL